MQAYDFHVKYINTYLTHIPLSLHDVDHRPIECQVCGHVMDPLLSISNKFNQAILEKSICQNCTYICFTQLPNKEWLSNFYMHNWDHSRTQAKIFNPQKPGYEDNIKLFSKLTDSKSIKILDIGAGYGNFLLACKKAGYTNLFGIEASEKRYNYCKNECNLNVFQCTSSDMSTAPDILEHAPYDLIHSHHVLEHVFDVKEFILNARALLKTGGLLEILVPNVESENSIFITHGIIHISNFSLLSLTILLRNNGFEILEASNSLSVIAKKIDSNQTNTPNKTCNDTPELFMTRITKKILSETCGRHHTTKNQISYVFADGQPNESYEISSLSFQKKLIISLKKNIFKYYYKKRPLRGPRKKFKNIFNPRNLIAYALTHSVPFKKYEVLGKITQSPSETKKPLVNFIYNSPNIVALLK